MYCFPKPLDLNPVWVSKLPLSIFQRRKSESRQVGVRCRNCTGDSGPCGVASKHHCYSNPPFSLLHTCDIDQGFRRAGSSGGLWHLKSSMQVTLRLHPCWLWNLSCAQADKPLSTTLSSLDVSSIMRRFLGK